MTQDPNQIHFNALTLHAESMTSFSINDAITQHPTRLTEFCLQLDDIWLDYSHQKITKETMALLVNYAKSCNLSNKIKELVSGAPVNRTEKRAVLHLALREVKHHERLPEKHQTNLRLRTFTETIHQQNHYADVICLGIGGSYLGPKMCVEALSDYAISPLRLHFVSTVDPAQLHSLLSRLNPKKTLLIIASKSFTTLETMTNAKVVIEWLAKPEENQIIAITANAKNAISFGVNENYIFPMWESIGGRFSIWSAIGLPLMLKIGWEQFQAFLDGAHIIDKHFQTTEIEKNIPVILALIDFWNSEFLSANALAIIPYSYQLRYFISYLQQLSMESLGKAPTVTANTGTIIFGQEGCDGQHAYHQLLHQGSQNIPVDFILVIQAFHAAQQKQQSILLASALSQAEALTEGNQAKDHTGIPGNKPYNVICIRKLTPKSLGMLISIYEHKTFVQSVLMDINAFDQFGVELGKKLLPNILSKLQSNNDDHLPLSIKNIIKHIKHEEDLK